MLHLKALFPKLIFMKASPKTAVALALASCVDDHVCVALHVFKIKNFPVNTNMVWNVHHANEERPRAAG